MSPTFMLGLWHGDDLLKEIFGSVNLWSGGSWKSHTWLAFASINKILFPWYFMRKCIGSYVEFMVDVSLLFLLFICLL